MSSIYFAKIQLQSSLASTIAWILVWHSCLGVGLPLLFEHMCVLCSSVTSHCDKNLMTVSNLSVCFGPTLLRPEQETVAAIMDIKFCNVVVEILIENYNLVRWTMLILIHMKSMFCIFSQSCIILKLTISCLSPTVTNI